VAFSRRALAAGVPHALNPAGFEPCLIVCPNSGPCAVVYCSLDKRDKIRWLGFTRYTTCDATQFRDSWAPHTQSQTQMHGVRR
jgi:hypothetical protein